MVRSVSLIRPGLNLQPQPIPIRASTLPLRMLTASRFTRTNGSRARMKPKLPVGRVTRPLWRSRVFAAGGVFAGLDSAAGWRDGARYSARRMLHTRPPPASMVIDLHLSDTHLIACRSWRSCRRLVAGSGGSSPGDIHGRQRAPPLPRRARRSWSGYPVKIAICDPRNRSRGCRDLEILVQSSDKPIYRPLARG